jgi:hypothetical protein
MQVPNVAYDVPGSLIGSKANLGLVIKLNTKPISDFLDTLENVTFNQFSLEMGPLENFPETKQPIKSLMMYFGDQNNRFFKRIDGNRVPVQAENEPQVEGTDENGTIVPAINAPNSLLFNNEKFIYTQQITSYVNALFRSGLPRTDLFLYPDNPSTPSASGDEFKQSLREFVLNKNSIKLKIYYSKVK